jgi:hypothetical protein
VDDDGPSTTPGASPPMSQTPRSQTPSGDPPGLRAQIGATVEAVRRLVRAHVDLAKTEVGEIVGEVKRMVALAGLALGALLMVALLLTLGLILFLGDWLFGSIGWGVLLGTGLLIDVAVMALLLALDVKGARLATSLLIAAAVGLVVGLALGLDVTHRGWAALGDSVAAAYDPNTRTVLLAVGVAAVIFGLLGFLSGVRNGLGNGLGSGIGSLIVGAIAGALIGLVTAISIPATVGAALGVLVALIVWPTLAGRDLIRTGVDGEAIARKFTPSETIGLTKETIEWVRARTPLVPKS